jgi:hypothetical protein
MSHHIPWCGCDPNHLPTHERGKTTGCKFNEDPKEVLIRDTEQYLNNFPNTGINTGVATALLRRWIELNG